MADRSDAINLHEKRVFPNCFEEVEVRGPSRTGVALELLRSWDDFWNAETL